MNQSPVVINIASESAVDEDAELSSPRVPAFDVPEVGPGNVSVSAFAAAICVNRSSSRRRWPGPGPGARISQAQR